MHPFTDNHKAFLILYLTAVMFSLAGCSTGYERDQNDVYYKYWNEGIGSRKDQLEADPETFVVLKNDNYAKDHMHVFYNGELIKGADINGVYF